MLQCFSLHHFRHKVSHLLRCLFLHLPCGVGVGSQGEPCIVVSQHTGYCLHIHPILQSQGSEGVPEVMEPDVFQPRVLENFHVELGDGIRMVHFSRLWGGEHPGIVRMLFMLCLEKLYRRLGEWRFFE